MSRKISRRDFARVAARAPVATRAAGCGRDPSSAVADSFDRSVARDHVAVEPKCLFANTRPEPVFR